MGDLCTKVGEREMRQKSVSLPPKAGELASLSLGVLLCVLRECRMPNEI